MRLCCIGDPSLTIIPCGAGAIHGRVYIPLFDFPSFRANGLF